MSQPLRIIWAVDAFMEDKKLHQKCVKAVKAWVKGKEAVIEPVFVVSPDQMKFPPEVFANLKGKVEESAQKNLKSLLKSTGIVGLLNTAYLASPSYSLQNAVHTLIDYARKERADLMVVTTQSRKGVSRFLFGSFAETLLLQSDIPVLLIGPKMRVGATLKRLLYATDLSEKCQDTFQEVMKLAEQHGMSLVLFNKVEYFSQYTSPSFASTEIYNHYLEEDIRNRVKSLEGMAEKARRRGISVQIVLDKNPRVNMISNAILRATQRTKADFLVMSAQSGPVRTALLGSITRQVIRDSSCPVWILHSKKRIEKKETVGLRMGSELLIA